MSNSNIEAQVKEIRAHMPEVYKDIQKKAQVIGKEAYALVRRGLRGEANCFYALERGRVVGTPFNTPGIMAELAQYMVEFGFQHLSIWPAPKEEAFNGTN